MNITVIMCTYNRCQGLAKTLESVATLTLPDSVRWEVLVVDNNSNDNTRDVVKDFSLRCPGRFRYVFEPQPGKSFALNTGVREARGDVLAFLDDDVTVEATWLRELTASLGNGEWAGAGGRILPSERVSPPPWLGLEEPYDLSGPLIGLFDFGMTPGRLDQPPYGSNMAFRKDILTKYGLFRTDLGPSPNPKIPHNNEDTEFGRRLLAAGERLRYEPSAVVYHPILQNRLQKSYFLGWFFEYGRAMVHEWEGGPGILGIPKSCVALFRLGCNVFPTRTLRWMLARDPRRRFYCKCLLWATAGQIVEICGTWRSAKTQASGAAAG